MTAALCGHDDFSQAAVIKLRRCEGNFQPIDRAADCIFIVSILVPPGRVIAPETVNCKADGLRHKCPVFRFDPFWLRRGAQGP
ncbi:MAG: hypothetical protein EPN34_00965 [Burkholderiaceae bacterium]|nr:MAG: hypothetical protein EPN34_00965 [Burkholderiaceae bacterium]